MAQRLATEYVKACLQLTEAQIVQLVDLFTELNILTKVKVYDNGNQEIQFEDDGGEIITLCLEREANQYVSQGSCRVSNVKMANALRKAISIFKGNAIVKRIYPTFFVEYHYDQGAVKKITEWAGGEQRVIYEYKNTIGELEHLFQQQYVEEEINRTHNEINRLLDQRNLLAADDAIKAIDLELAQLTQKLFTLEA